MSKPPSVRIVVDGSIELPGEQLESLNVCVVPRQVAIGRDKYSLDSQLTMANVLPRYARSRRTILSVPGAHVFQNVFQTALRDHDALISIHKPPFVDKTTIPARLARNMLWPARIYILELAISDLGVARMTHLLANLAYQGWSLEEIILLIERAQTLIRTFFITPKTAIPKEQISNLVSNGNPLSSFWSQLHLLTELNPISETFQVIAAEKNLPSLGEHLWRMVKDMQIDQVQRFDSQVNFALSWRQEKHDKLMPAFLTLIDGENIPQQQAPGWPPNFLSYLDHSFIEICVAPPEKELMALMVLQAERNKIVKAATERYTRSVQRLPVSGKLRLSDYRVQLK